MLWFFILAWLLLAVVSFFAVRYFRLFGDYGSSYLFLLGISFLVFGFFSSLAWFFGWIFIIISFYGNVRLGVG